MVKFLALTVDDLRSAAIGRSLFRPASLQEAVDRLGFVQADPIRAPARAQDLTLRHRVDGYRAGDLETRYQELDVHEDTFVNYGFVSREVQSLMHPRGGPKPWTAARGRHVRALLAFVRANGTVHPRAVDEYFSHGSVTNNWGGSSSATTHLLEAMHYRGLLRVARRDAGIRLYTVHEHDPAPKGTPARHARLDALVDVIVRKYGPLPAVSLSGLIRRLRHAVPQWEGELDRTLQRARRRLSRASIDGVDWFWPANEELLPPNFEERAGDDTVRLLAPFDPVAWDRRRFEILWGWAYRFEAYTPAARRRFGYYALPLLWRNRVIGWGNLTVRKGVLDAVFGYVASSPPRSREFRRALDAELESVRAFLGASSLIWNDRLSRACGSCGKRFCRFPGGCGRVLQRP